MFINPINSVTTSRNNYKKSRQVYSYKSTPDDIKTDTVSFKAGQNLTILRNQLKIYHAQNIWAKDLMFRMPESALEKEVLLEMLAKRLKLDEYVRLTNERFNFIANSEMDEESKASRVKKYDEAIKLTAEVNRSALQYFKDIEKLTDEYLEKKLVKPSQMEKFYSQLKKQNINADGKYSTAELIEILKTGKVPGKATPVEDVKKATTPIYHNKKDLLAAIEASYEKTLRGVVNVYVPSKNNYEFEVFVARQVVEGKFKDSIKKVMKDSPDIEKSIKKVYESIEKKYIHKHNMLAKLLLPSAGNNVTFYNLNNLWVLMQPIEADLKIKIKELNSLKAQLLKNPKDKNLMEQIEQKEDAIGELKDKWVYYMLNSVKYESENYKTLEKMGMKDVYNYLVDENPTVQKHFFAFKERVDNNNHISDEYWETNILEMKPKKKD